MVESILASVRCRFCPHCGCDVVPEQGRADTTCPQCGRALSLSVLLRAPILRGFIPLVLATGFLPGLLALLGVMIEVAGLAQGSGRTFTCAAFLVSPFVLYAWSSVILRRSGEPVGILDGLPVAIFMAFANVLLLSIGLVFIGVAVS